MAASNHASIEVRFESGDVVREWTAFECADSFLELPRLTFTTRPRREKLEEYRERLGKGEKVTVVINGAKQGPFVIQAVRKRIGREGVEFSFGCASPLETARQATVDPTLSFFSKSDVPVSKVVQDALFPFGFDALVGDANAYRGAITGKRLDGGAPSAITVDSLKHQEAKAQDGEQAYRFCSRIFSRLGVALRCDHEGRLLLSAPDYTQEPAYVLSQTFDNSGPGDRMLEGIEIEDTNDDQFSECIVRGVAPDKFGTKKSTQPLATVVGWTYRVGDNGPSYKPLHTKVKSARDVKACQAAATLILGLRAARAYQLRCEVDGCISTTGRVWSVDTVARVICQADAIDTSMWILERTLRQSRERGQTTALTLIPLGALLLGEVPE